MADKLSNSQRKKILGDRIKAEKARIQASIDACKKKRADNRRKHEELAEAQEKLRLQELANLNKKMVVIYAEIAGEIVILTIVDPSLMMSSYSSGMNHHIVYGNSEYRRLSTISSYNNKGKRSERRIDESYTVSTADGVNFNVFGTDGKPCFSFTSSIHYPTLAGKSVSGVQFDQFWYDPSKSSSDDKTAKFHAELDRLIKEEPTYHRS
jgi:hypothetical protein